MARFICIIASDTDFLRFPQLQNLSDSCRLTEFVLKGLYDINSRTSNFTQVRECGERSTVVVMQNYEKATGTSKSKRGELFTVGQ